MPGSGLFRACATSTNMNVNVHACLAWHNNGFCPFHDHFNCAILMPACFVPLSVHYILYFCIAISVFYPLSHFLLQMTMVELCVLICLSTGTWLFQMFYLLLSVGNVQCCIQDMVSWLRMHHLLKCAENTESTLLGLR